MLNPLSDHQRNFAESFTFCLLFAYCCLTGDALNISVWERESNGFYQDRTIQGSDQVEATSLTSCASFSLANGHNLFAYSKLLKSCHTIQTTNTIFVQNMTSMRLYKQKGTTVNNAFDGETLKTQNYTLLVVKADVERDDARTKCSEIGGHLVTIDSLVKQNDILDLLRTYSSYFDPYDFWIEGTSVSGGPWTFPDGSLMPMDEGTFWRVGAPNDNESCVRMRRGQNYLWDDIRCDVDYGFICEIP